MVFFLSVALRHSFSFFSFLLPLVNESIDSSSVGPRKRPTMLKSSVEEPLVKTVAVVINCSLPLTVYGMAVSECAVSVPLSSFEVVRVIHEKLLDMVGNVQYVHTHRNTGLMLRSRPSS